MVSALANGALHQAARRRRQIRDIWRSEGYRGITDRFLRIASERLKPKGVSWEVLPADVIAADLSRPFRPKFRRIEAGDPISINWITTPSGAGSGGHTTTFRMVKYLEKNGFKNTVYFYDTFKGDHKYYVDIARNHYGVECDIRDTREGILDADAVMATSWASAYAVYNSRGAGKRFYFVQDYEPNFYPTGANSLLAENTYRMGFHGVTAGRWLAEKLAAEFGMQTNYFPFGCDTTKYHREPGGRRSGIAFYARAETPRRGLELGLLALEIFAKRNPGIDVHFYGERTGELPFKFTNHGLVTPVELNNIYNKCFAGLSLSLTNVSLVPHEMLAAGCIPVVNDADHNRMVLDNPFVQYAAATPHALADALEGVVKSEQFEALSAKAAHSVQSVSWDQAGAAVANALRGALVGRQEELC